MEWTERYVLKFYQYLAEDKLMGQICNDCGTHHLFPMPVCGNCQGTNLSWKELRKEGKVLYFSISNMPPIRFAKFTPCAFGSVQLSDGPVVNTMIEGINLEEAEQERAHLPIDVDIVIKEIAGNPIPIGKVK
jgi:uncharacterized OB-fold protein